MSKGTIIRTVVLLLALINQLLAVFGKSPIPISEAQINEIVVQVDLLVATVMTAVTGIWAWWKNNSFTKEALESDKYLLELKNREGK